MRLRTWQSSSIWDERSRCDDKYWNGDI